MAINPYGNVYSGTSFIAFSSTIGTGMLSKGLTIALLSSTVISTSLPFTLSGIDTLSFIRFITLSSNFILIFSGDFTVFLSSIASNTPSLSASMSWKSGIPSLSVSIFPSSASSIPSLSESGSLISSIPSLSVSFVPSIISGIPSLSLSSSSVSGIPSISVSLFSSSISLTVIPVIPLLELIFIITIFTVSSFRPSISYSGSLNVLPITFSLVLVIRS